MDELIDRLEYWKTKVSEAKTGLKNTREEIDKRERMYRGGRDMHPVTKGDRHKNGDRQQAMHVFNLIAENIDSEIDVNIPQPKVTPIRKQDEPLAKMIEDFLRNELDRMQFEEMNDMQERIVPVQGGSWWQVGWDNEQKTHTTVGEVYVDVKHPKQMLPQPGVYTGVEDMSYVAMEIPKTKDDILRRYGVDLRDEGEEEAGVKSSEAETLQKDMVTQVVVYYRNKNGGIGRYSYAGSHELEDIEDFGARQRRRCAKCGAPETGAPEQTGEPTEDGTRPAESGRRRRDECPYCGSRKWETDAEDFRTIPEDYTVEVTGRVLPAFETSFDELGNPTESVPVRYPYYRVNEYPLVIQRNISVFGELLGESDVDKIEDQQNTMNQLNKVILDRIFRAGTKISLPRDVEITREEENGEVIRLDGADQATQIRTFDFTGDISPQLAYRAALYEEPRRVLGITDSFQGRSDATATSGVAKEFAASQSAGRIESKRRMKNAAYARIFELIFKTALANCDEPRPMTYRENGETQYGVFDPMAFYDRDEAGEWYVNDRFLFSCDTSAPLSGNRTAMWQEVTSQFSSGSYGDPAQDETRLIYWQAMEELHYPLAGAAVKAIKERMERAQEAAQLQAAMIQEQQTMMPMAGAGADNPSGAGAPAPFTQGSQSGGDQTQEQSLLQFGMGR